MPIHALPVGYPLPSAERDCGTDQHCKHFCIVPIPCYTWFSIIDITGLMHLPVILSRLSGLMPDMVKTDKRIISAPLTQNFRPILMTPLISERSKGQLDEWWMALWITEPDGSFTDRCLNGGAGPLIGAWKGRAERLVSGCTTPRQNGHTRLKPIFMYLTTALQASGSVPATRLRRKHHWGVQYYWWN